MLTLAIAFAAFAALGVAYVVYGNYLSRSVLSLRADEPCPSREREDGQDFVPTRKSVVFGHHFTSIAGTGPIVGPALAVFWGWLPAMLWVVLGAIFIGGVHDFFALVLSIRSRGQTIGEIAGRLIAPRTKLLFLLVLALALWIVLAIFGLVIASIFSLYPESVLAVWIAMPLAVAVGWLGRRGRSMVLASWVALGIIYLLVVVGVYFLRVDLGSLLKFESPFLSPVVLWTIVLMIYCYAASVLPVATLLQPRDFINSLQLYVALALLVTGFGVAALSGEADLLASTEAISTNVPADAPPIFPFLFITIACGACSGFHCLVSSGTSSKQIANAQDAKAVGYGAMLLESGLAVLVILACCAGIGMGAIDHSNPQRVTYVEQSDGQQVRYAAAWQKYYRAKLAVGDTQAENGGTGGWRAMGLKNYLAAFVDGGANFLRSLGIPLALGIGIVSVLVASFAATTLDTATRLHRYVLQEIGESIHISPLRNKHVATSAAVGVGLLIAIFAGSEPGKGGTLLWPLFGATNQLLAGLALTVATFYLWRRSKAIFCVAIPALFMLLTPAFAMTYDLYYHWLPWHENGSWLLTAFAAFILGLQVWMLLEASLVFKKSRGVLEARPDEIMRESTA